MASKWALEQRAFSKLADKKLKGSYIVVAHKRRKLNVKQVDKLINVS